MQYLAERTRQALGLGARDFHPTCLEAEHRAVHEASVYGNQLHTLERSLAKWSASTEDLMNAAGRFLADAPRPRRFAQSDLSDPTTLTAAPPSLPPEFERLNSPSLVRRLAAGTPLAVTDMVRLGLAEPIAVWLAALDAGKERLARLERQRLRYDAARRALHGAARAPGADEVGSAAHTHLIQLEQEHEPVMSEFRDELEALDRHLVWLADGGARLKATLVSALQCVNSAALRGALMPPEGLMVGFPRDLLERPETLRAAAAAAAAPAGPGAAAAAVETAAAMSDAAVEAATAAAITAAGLDVPPPQLVMLGPEAPTAPAGAAAIGGGVTDVVLIVPPGTAGVAAEAAVEAAEAVGFAAAQGAALAAPRGLLQEERKEERLLQSAATGGPAAARLYRLVTRPERHDAVRAAWRALVQRAMESERHKTLAEHAEEQMRDVKERSGFTGGFLMRPEAAPEYVMAGRRRLPGGGPLQFLRDTLLGPPAAETKPHPAGGGAGGSAATSPRAAPTTVDYAAAAREQMHEVATHGSAAAAAAAAEPPMAPASEGRTPSGGPASFLVDTLLGPEPVSEPGPGSYVPPSAAVVGAAIAPPVEPLTYIPPPAPVPLEPLQPLERLEPEPSSSEDLAPPVPVPMETYAGGMAADEPEYPEVPYESLAPSASAAATSQQVTERAAAAMAAADAALEVSTASMEAATAAIEAAAAAAAAASAAQEAATDAAVAAVDLGGAAEEAEMPSTPPGRRVAAVPDYAREYGRIGAGGEPGVGPGGGSASDLEAAESGAAAPPPSSEGEEEEKLDLPDFSGLDIDKHGRCGKPAELPPFAKEYGKIGAGGPTGAASDEEPAGGGGAAAAAVHPGYEGFSGMDVTSFGLPAEGAAASGPPPSTVAAMAAALPPERMPAVPAEVGPAAVSEQLGEMHLESFGLTPTTKAEVTPPEAAAAAAAAEPQGEGRRGDSGVPGVFGALKRMVESELGGAGAPAEVAGGKAREAGGVVVAEPAGPTAIDA